MKFEDIGKMSFVTSEFVALVVDFEPLTFTKFFDEGESITKVVRIGAGFGS